MMGEASDDGSDVELNRPGDGAHCRQASQISLTRMQQQRTSRGELNAQLLSPSSLPSLRKVGAPAAGVGYTRPISLHRCQHSTPAEDALICLLHAAASGGAVQQWDFRAEGGPQSPPLWQA